MLCYNTLLFKEKLSLLKDTPFLVCNFILAQEMYENNIMNICLKRIVWSIGIKYYYFISKMLI